METTIKIIDPKTYQGKTSYEITLADGIKGWLDTKTSDPIGNMNPGKAVKYTYVDKTSKNGNAYKSLSIRLYAAEQPAPPQQSVSPPVPPTQSQELISAPTLREMKFWGMIECMKKAYDGMVQGHCTAEEAKAYWSDWTSIAYGFIDDIWK